VHGEEVTMGELYARYPRLYHMAAAGSWPRIEGHGLRSTTALLDLFEIRGTHRDRIESQHRPESITIEHRTHGIAVIRDQKPMSDSGLIRALPEEDGLTPSDWYRILNKKVFFWLTPERLQRLVDAKAYRNQRQTVIVLDTRKLLTRHSDNILLSPINSGCTKPFPHSRGVATFMRIEEYPFADRLRRRLEPIVELAVDYLVPNVASLTVHVREIGGGEPPRELYSS
jgi:hypothetical protein